MQNPTLPGWALYAAQPLPVSEEQFWQSRGTGLHAAELRSDLIELNMLNIQIHEFKPSRSCQRY